MINFYSLYNGTLDREDLKPYIEDLIRWGVVLWVKYEKIQHIIKRHPNYAYQYSMFFKRGRWYEAEPVIMQSSYYAYQYAMDIVQDRWLEAEPLIKQNPQCWKEYKRKFSVPD